MKTNGAADIRICVFLDQLHEPIGAATVKPMAPMPNKVDASTRSERSALHLHQPSIPQFTNRTIGYPMEKVTLVDYFKLPREED